MPRMLIACLAALTLFVCRAPDCRAQNAGGAGAAQPGPLLRALDSPILLNGDAKTAYRDPAVLHHEGRFFLFCTMVETEPDAKVYWYTVLSTSDDLKTWSKPGKLTPKDQKLNYSSPGNVIRFNNQWVLCLQTYPVPGMEFKGRPRAATGAARIHIMRSDDLETWSEPELLKVKGPDVPVKKMGRLIDPYLIQDHDDPAKWWCFYKEGWKGVGYSWSRDLKTWRFEGRTKSGENVCVLRQEDGYVMFHSPHNGIGIKRSKNLKDWQDEKGLITLGQKDWEWATRRLTAGFVLDLRDVPSVGRYVMFFHGEGPPADRQTLENFLTRCPIGIAWSEDLKEWSWPGKSTAAP